MAEPATASSALARTARIVIVVAVSVCLLVIGWAVFRDEHRAGEVRDLTAALNRRAVTIDALNQFADRLDCQQAQQVVFSRAIAAVLQTAVDDRATTEEGRALVALLFTAFDDDPRISGKQPCPTVNIRP